MISVINMRGKWSLVSLLISIWLSQNKISLELRYIPEAQKLNVISECKQSVATSWHFFLHNTLDIFNARHIITMMQMMKIWLANIVYKSIRVHAHMHADHQQDKPHCSLLHHLPLLKISWALIHWESRKMVVVVVVVVIYPQLAE